MTEKEVTVVIDTSDPPFYFDVRGIRYELRHPPETLLIDKERTDGCLPITMSVEIDRDRAKHCFIGRFFIFPKGIPDKISVSDIEALGWSVHSKLLRARKKYDEYQLKEET